MLNTFAWLHKKDGGFTQEDVIIAIKNKNITKIKEMKAILRQHICNILIRKLLQGKGNRELEILRYFYFGLWSTNNDNFTDNMITIKNKKRDGIALKLTNKLNVKKVLTKQNINEGDIVKKTKEFYIPAKSVFVWFVPDGNYILSINLKSNQNKQNMQFKGKEFPIYRYNINFNIY